MEEALNLESIRNDDYAWLQAWLHERSSIVLESGRKFLAEKRLRPLLWQHHLADFRALFGQLKEQPDTQVAAEVLEAMTQSETWFFRDMPYFDLLRDRLLHEARYRRAGKRVRIWSAGCSTGQEAYSIAMLLHHTWGPHWADRAQIVATDISPRQVAHAREGSFSREEVNRGLPVAYLARYFEQRGTRWHVADELKEGIEFSTMRLDKPWGFHEEFDIVLLRNVLVYFDEATRLEMLWRIRKQMDENAVLLLGAAEKSDLTEGLGLRSEGKIWYYERCALGAGADRQLTHQAA
jgi:chemotaxis protein methyltransferase CheR